MPFKDYKKTYINDVGLYYDRFGISLKLYKSITIDFEIIGNTQEDDVLDIIAEIEGLNDPFSKLIFKV